MSKWWFSLLVVVMLGLVSAPSASFFFDTAQNESKTIASIMYASSVVFEVTTANEVLCRYSQTKGTPYNSMVSFNDNFYTIHKKELSSISDGVYKYYVRCRSVSDINNVSDGINELEATFKISNPIAANIVLTDDVLTAGKYEVVLQTTKTPLSVPKLSYSYDGVVYTPLVLQGSGSSWKGYLVIDDASEEKVGSFKFEGTDLEGRQGNLVYGRSVFVVDTRPPKQIVLVNAIGEYGNIEVKWFVDEDSDDDIERINVYRSDSPNVDVTDVYESLDADADNFNDGDVENGKTYYYRVAAEDSAGNLASLSREVKATALTSQVDSSSSTTGLSPELYGKVDAVLVQADLLLDDISSAQSSLSSKKDDESYLKALGVLDALSSAKSEVESVKRSVAELKSQDLSDASLTPRLSSSEGKLNVIKKKIPESYTLLDTRSQNREVTDEQIRIVLLEKVPDLSSSLLEKSIKETKQVIKEKGVSLKHEMNVFEIHYLDGSKDTKTLMEHSIDSTLEASENSFVVLKLPAGSLSADALQMKNIDFNREKDTLISFNAGTKKISYVYQGAVSSDSLDSIIVTPIVILDDAPPLTGYFLSEISSTNKSMALLVLVVVGLLGYLVYMKKTKASQVASDFVVRAKRVKELRSQGRLDEASSLYDTLKLDYLSLSSFEKARVFEEVKSLVS